jgi:hypothetical protein
VYNRIDWPQYQVWLSPFDIWLGSVAGATDTKCAGPVHVPSAAGPFVVDCRGASGGFVTLRLSGDVADRYLYECQRALNHPSLAVALHTHAAPRPLSQKHLCAQRLCQ